MKTTIEPVIPFVWPEPRVLEGTAQYLHDFAPARIFESAASIIGVLAGLTQDAYDWLGDLASAQEGCVFQILLAIDAPWSAEEKVLRGLLALQEEHPDRIAVRLLLAADSGVQTTDTLLVSGAGSGPTCVLAGPCMPSGPGGAGLQTLGIAATADVALCRAFANWVDWQWRWRAIPLTEETVAIPALVPARGSPDAETKWRKYIAFRQAGNRGQVHSSPAPRYAGQPQGVRQGGLADHGVTFRPSEPRVPDLGTA